MSGHASCGSIETGQDVFGRSWRGRRVSVIGLGKSGLAAAELLCRIGCRVRVSEAQDTAQTQAIRRSLEASGAEAVELGGHSARFIEESDAVVVSPGVPESAEPIRRATQEGVSILSEIELAFSFCPSPVIGVTGTNGKSTAVSLIAALLKACGREAVACGNLGTPFSSVMGRLTPRSVAVVEVSSFQLLRCDRFRPAIGVLLNLGTNHLDRHRDDASYVAAKARLFARQTPDDWAVLNGCDARIMALAERLQARRVWFGENHANPPALRLAPQTLQALSGSAQAVLQVGRILGVPDPLTWQTLRAFRGLPHRLEHVATVGGIHFVNDSKSTTPESCLYALSRIAGDVVVILGGRNKGLDFTPLVRPLHEDRVKGIVLIGESRTRLRPLLNGSSLVRESETLRGAVQAAVQLAAPGTTVLLSPACASFDMFRDFEERGEQFKAIVRRLRG